MGVSIPRTAHQRRTERLEIDPAEAKIVRKIFKWCIEGISTAGIVQRLSDAAVPSRADTQTGYTIRKSKRWGRATVAGILRNKAYTGEWHFNKVKVIRPKIKGEGKYKFIKRPSSEHLIVEIPAIIDTETWSKAQAQLEQNRHNTRPPKNQYLLRGYCRCAKCGKSLVGRPNKEYAAYICSHNNTNHGNERCHSPQFSTRQIDAAVWEFVYGIITNPKRIVQFQERP